MRIAAGRLLLQCSDLLLQHRNQIGYRAVAQDTSILRSLERQIAYAISDDIDYSPTAMRLM